MSRRPTFSSRFIAILTMAGLAIGLGNVWRFPYMMGQHGGSAFLFLYLFFMLLLAVPALMSEWALGRATQAGPINAYRKVFGRKIGLLISLLLSFSVFMALSYYNLVIANIVYSTWFAAQHGFSAANLDTFHQGLDRSGLQYLIAIGVTLFCLWIVLRGLHRGIETINRWVVPFFAGVALYLVFSALNLDGAWQELKAFLKPDFSQAGPSTWFAAMGQACFSIGVSGMLGVMYGSYLRQQEQLAPTALVTGVMDTGAALLASLFVVPAVLVFGLNMGQGPGLLFNTLPQLFEVLPGGRVLAPLFLLAWVAVALLTVIGTFDAIVGGLQDLNTRLSRRHWIALVGGMNLLVMLPVAFNTHWIGTLDTIFGSGMFMFGALLAVIGAGWGLGRTVLQEQIGGRLATPLSRGLTWWVRFVVPLALAFILISFLLNLGQSH